MAPDYPSGTRIIVTFGSDLPRDPNDMLWADNAIVVSTDAEPPYAGRPSPHWMDAAQLFDALSYMEPPETTVRQYIEGLEGCSGGKAGKIATPFGKNRTCRSMTEAETATLLTELQKSSRPVKAKALGPVGESAINPDLSPSMASRPSPASVAFTAASTAISALTWP